MADPSANDNAKGIANTTGDETKEKTKGKMTATEEKSGNSSNKKKSSAASKVTAQMQQMKDANTKYKNLLKMAKDRIEQQEAELKKLKENESKRTEDDTASRDSNDYLGEVNDNEWDLVSVSQRIRVDRESNGEESSTTTDEIWALCEWRQCETEEQRFSLNNKNPAQSNNTKKKQWKRFESEADLSDFIRRDTGEPLTLPPYSLTQEQSSQMASDNEKKVSAITEEYRRFRVRSEMVRKQMDAQIKDLQSSQMESAQRQIEGQPGDEEKQSKGSKGKSSESKKLQRMRAEVARQEDEWKKAYDILLKENEALKSPDADALLASQWRQRYEACAKERDEAVQKLQSAQQRHEQHKRQSVSSLMSPASTGGSDGKYEMKYRDLKESFRLYRKKAKEIFESQAAATASESPEAYSINHTEDDPKLRYLKNLMLNYLTADLEVRDHMETAIGTVLKFTPEDIAAIEKKKTDSSWGAYIGYT